MRKACTACSLLTSSRCFLAKRYSSTTSDFPNDASRVAPSVTLPGSKSEETERKQTMLQRERDFEAASASSSSMGSSQNQRNKQLSRAESLSRWNCETTGVSSTLTSYLPTALQPASVSARSSTGGVEWDLHERMDYYLEYACPGGWQVQERLSNNFVSIQCTPPRSPSATAAHGTEVPPGPTVHGLSLSSYAYPTKVKDPDANALMSAFLKQFNRSVGNTLCVLGSTATKEAEITSLNDGIVRKCTELSKQVGGAVGELTFRSPQSPVHAHGLCRAFYHTSRRVHYVALFAVPEEEFAATEDLVMHAVSAVSESGGESTNTKWTE